MLIHLNIASAAERTPACGNFIARYDLLLFNAFSVNCTQCIGTGHYKEVISLIEIGFDGDVVAYLATIPM